MAPPPRPSAEPKTPLYCDVLRDGPLRCPPDEVPSPPPPASHGRSTFVTALIITIPVLAFVVLCLSILIFVQRRRLRQRRAALLEAALAPAAPATFPDDDGPGGEGEVVHHVWHIRTVGLDDAAIESIALTRYRAAGGGGVLGASDCTVCLGEFHDGELLRLLPKCAHAFHVQCIDTWLRAHVSCPLCRADVTVDPAAAAAAADAEQPPGADGADASAEQSSSNTRTLELERHGQQANEQQELRVQIDQQPDHSSTPERPAREPGARAQNFRRVASMDSPSPPTASAEEAPEDDQAGGEKQGSAARCRQNLVTS